MPSRSQPHRARDEVALAPQLLDHAIDLRERGAQRTLQPLTRSGHRHAAAIAFQKPKVQAGFESFDHVTERGG
jgi:hypothetical protein